MKSQIDPDSIKGHLFLIVGPSGSGKSTLIDYVLKQLPGLHFPISATTRDQRPGETEGEDYFYLSDSEFDQKIADGEFLEYATVHETTKYGTLLSEVVKPLQENKNVIRHLDYQGVRSIRKLLTDNNVHVIFVSAGDWSSLQDRINSRGKLSEEELSRRQASFEIEMEFGKSETNLIIDNSDGCLARAQAELLDYVAKVIA